MNGKIRLSCVPQGKRILLALSGGADSVALLRLLVEERDAGNITLCAAHMEHGIRGEASEGDMRFVQALCEQFHVPLTVRRVHIPSLAREQSMGLEAAAREARHAFLRETMRQTQSDVIALAHHMDDQAETCLMHILRGSGLKGAGGMGEQDGILLRPLLHVRKKEIMEYLEGIGQSWREDATNAENDNPRNILRNRVLPLLETAYPASVRALDRFSAIAREEDALLDEYAKRIVRSVAPNVCRIDTENPTALLRRAVRMANDTLPFDAVEAILAANGKWEAMGITAERDGKALYIRKSGFSTAEEYPLEDVFDIAPCEAVPVKDTFWRQTLDASVLEGSVVRTRRENDRIQPFGMRGSKSLSDYFTDKKIASPQRAYLLLVARGNEILYVPGVGISEKVKIRPNGECVLLAMKNKYIREVEPHA